MRATPRLPAGTPTQQSDVNAGRVAGVFGLRGELKIAPSRIGEDALARGIEVRATLRDGESRVLRVRALRRHQGRPLASFEGIDDATAAAALVGATLTIERSAVTLARGEYFDDDLIGCALIDAADGRALGAVVAVEHYPAQDVLLIGDRRAMVPMVRAFIASVDLELKQITVTLPSGLLDPGEVDEA